MNNKKTKIRFMSKLVSIAILGAILPTTMQYFNKDINKVYAIGPKEGFSGELDSSGIGILCLNPEYCNFVDDGYMLLYVPRGVTSLAQGALANLPANVKGVVLPDTIKNLNTNTLGDNEKEINNNAIKNRKIDNIFIHPDCNFENASGTNQIGDIKVNKYYEFTWDERYGTTFTAPLINTIALDPKYAPKGPAGDTFSIPDNFTSMDDGAFQKCNFKKIKFSDNISVLPKDLCKGNENVECVILPEKCTKIGKGCFKGCKNLKQVGFPKSSLTLIDDEAFAHCNLSETELPSATVFGKAAFAYSKIKDIIIPPDCVHIDNFCFFGCDNVNCLEFGKDENGFCNLRFIGNKALAVNEPNHGMIIEEEIENGNSVWYIGYTSSQLAFKKVQDGFLEIPSQTTFSNYAFSTYVTVRPSFVTILDKKLLSKAKFIYSEPACVKTTP